MLTVPRHESSRLPVGPGRMVPQAVRRSDPAERLCLASRQRLDYAWSRHPRVHSHPRVTATGPDRHGAMRFGADVTLPLAGSKQVSNRARCSVPLGVAGATPCPQRFSNSSRGVSSFASVGWTTIPTGSASPKDRNRSAQQNAADSINNRPQDKRRDRDWAMRHAPGPDGAELLSFK